VVDFICFGMAGLCRGRSFIGIFRGEGEVTRGSTGISLSNATSFSNIAVDLFCIEMFDLYPDRSFIVGYRG
jgi:hypothetical protein